MRLGKFCAIGSTLSNASMRRLRTAAGYEATSYRSPRNTQEAYRRKMAWGLLGCVDVLCRHIEYFIRELGKQGDYLVQFIARMIRATKLESYLYEEVKIDKYATSQALVVVLLSGLAASIGIFTHTGLGGLVMGGLVALLAWYVWTFMTYIIGAKLFPVSKTSASHRELWRALGFASAPGMFRVFGAIPGLTGIAFLVSAVCMLMAAVIAVRQTFDYTSTVRAAGVCVPGWLVHIFLLFFLLLLIG
jgi:hypothetical protein